MSAQNLESLFISGKGLKNVLIILESNTPNIGYITQFAIAATHPIRSTGISDLLREARRQSEISGDFSRGCEFSRSGSGMLIAVGKPNETEKEWRLLLPRDDPDLRNDSL